MEGKIKEIMANEQNLYTQHSYAHLVALLQVR